jgi:hypothetical protein
MDLRGKERVPSISIIILKGKTAAPGCGDPTRQRERADSPKRPASMDRLHEHDFSLSVS